MKPLVERYGEVVPSRVLTGEAWPWGTTSNALTVNVSRLRRKLAAAGFPLALDTVRGSGYMLRYR